MDEGVGAFSQVLREDIKDSDTYCKLVSLQVRRDRRLSVIVTVLHVIPGST